MAQTNLMRADEISNGFNSVADQQYWRASIAGTRTHPEVNFNSRASMVRVTYNVASGEFSLMFSKSACAFGDFLASAYRSMSQVLARLKAAGLPFPAPLDDDGALRLEYDPRRKVFTVNLARLGDDWPDAESLAFKVPERNKSETAIDGL